MSASVNIRCSWYNMSDQVNNGFYFALQREVLGVRISSATSAKSVSNKLFPLVFKEPATSHFYNNVWNYKPF